MFGIMAHSLSYGIFTWCKRDGKIELYATREEAEKAAEEYNKLFTLSRYWVEKYE